MGFLVYLILFSSILRAEILESDVYSIEKKFIKLTNGRVVFFKNRPINLEKNDRVKMIVNTKSYLISFQKINSFESTDNKEWFNKSQFNEDIKFTPTIVNGIEEAHKIFERSNPNYKRISECSDRAHIWAFDELKYSGTKSMKAFVFFTASYINSVRFKWWFHVAPMYRVKSDEMMTDMVMDFRYSDKPLKLKEWTDLFVFTKRPCKVTTKFSEYDVNPQTENCYLIFESMHYKIPGEIHRKELEGKFKNKTSESELRASFQYAFKSSNGNSL